MKEKFKSLEPKQPEPITYTIIEKGKRVTKVYDPYAAANSAAQKFMSKLNLNKIMEDPIYE